MAFFLPFALGAAAAAAGFHIIKNRSCDCKDGECSCGCEPGKCECGPDCDCGCNSTGKVKKKVVKTAGAALEKIRSGLAILENNINEQTIEKIKSGLKTVESKISDIQEKLKEEKPEAKPEG